MSQDGERSGLVVCFHGGLHLSEAIQHYAEKCSYCYWWRVSGQCGLIILSPSYRTPVRGRSQKNPRNHQIFWTCSSRVSGTSGTGAACFFTTVTFWLYRGSDLNQLICIQMKEESCLCNKNRCSPGGKLNDWHQRRTLPFSLPTDQLTVINFILIQNPVASFWS